MIILQCDRCGHRVEIMPDPNMPMKGRKGSMTACGDKIYYNDYGFNYVDLPRMKEVFLCKKCSKDLPRIILECDDAVKGAWDKKMNEWLNQAGKEESEEEE